MLTEESTYTRLDDNDGHWMSTTEAVFHHTNPNHTMTIGHNQVTENHGGNVISGKIYDTCNIRVLF